MAQFWAHSDPKGLPRDSPNAQWQLLAEHLLNVSKSAYRLAKTAAPGNEIFRQMAALAGILHDYGKYQPCFQSMLDGKGAGCPHALYGALAVRNLPTGTAARDWALPVVHAIAAHHAGLRDHHSLKTNTSPANAAWEAERDQRIAEGLWAAACKDQKRIDKALREIKEPAPFRFKDLFTRMLLSCLVDADRLDTAGLEAVQAPLQANLRLEQLLRHLHEVQTRARKKGGSAGVLKVRDEVQQHCAEAAMGEARLLSLTVPTGGGKTLAAMRFALERANARPDELRRVIVVIPYLSIIEQNAGVYRDVFGNQAILEHHSGAVQRLKHRDGNGAEALAPQQEDGRDQGKRRRPVETENWDAPLIVTTSVRFFESLFSNHPSDLRRIHNVARSVIILDEVQTLPRRLLVPLLGILRELTENWGCTLVLSTATQPAFEARGPRQDYLWPEGTITPIVPTKVLTSMHTQLRRVHIEWRLSETISWETLASKLAQHPQVLCVLNIRDHVAAVYAEVCKLAEIEEQRQGIFHLSTRMCPQHRLNVLEEIRDRLERGLVCRIISSQLIEAGVDLSVPVAYRALGPLDSIIQVAGRVDREGKLTEAAGRPAGKLIVFRPEDDRMPPHEYRQAAAITETLGKTEEPQTDDLSAMQRYFESYYDGADKGERGEDLARMREDGWLQFGTLAEEFEYINSRAQNVFVPYGDGVALLDELRLKRFLDFDLLRKLQRYTVGLQPWEMEKVRQSGSVYPLWEDSELLVCSELAYEAKGRGLLPEIPADRFTV